MAALQRTDGPTGLILTRQNVPNLSSISVQDRREGVLKGGYIARREEGELELIILASGSELNLALQAAEKLGNTVRVVSVPLYGTLRPSGRCLPRVRTSTLCRNRMAVEAGVSDLWRKYVGLDGVVVGIDRFGMSAPGNTVLEELGMSVDNVVKHAALAGLGA